MTADVYCFLNSIGKAKLTIMPALNLREKIFATLENGMHALDMRYAVPNCRHIPTP